MNTSKFEDDLEDILDKLKNRIDNKALNELDRIRRKLVELYLRGIVKTNHSVMEFIVSWFLLKKGYEKVDVELNVASDLVCDVYGVRGDSSIIVEVETGFTPPEHSLDPITYNKVRVISKITRYSHYADKFSLAVPPYYLILEIPLCFVKPPSARKLDEIIRVKKLCDIYYRNPPVTIEQIKYAKLHTIIIINVDDLEVEEADPESYLDVVLNRYFSIS
ncbi:MAG: hypothetical protein QXY40_03230 [Candidatus Methanomethylicia archaeon]